MESSSQGPGEGRRRISPSSGGSSPRSAPQSAGQGESAMEGEQEHYTEFDRQHTGDDEDYESGSHNERARPVPGMDITPDTSPEQDAIRRRRERLRQARLAEEQSVAYAGALVGEAVVESPLIVAPPTFSQSDVEDLVRRMESMNQSDRESNAEEVEGKKQKQGMAPRRMDRTGGVSGDFGNDHDDDDDGDYERVDYYNVYGADTTEEDDEGDANYDDDDDEGGGPGLIAAARGWWARRRESRRRAELERQVELQRRKLQLEARMRERAKLTRRADNAFERDDGGSALEAKLQALTGDRMNRKVAAEAAWGRGGTGGGIIGGICGVESAEDEYGYCVSGSGSADSDDSIYASDDENDFASGGRKRSMRVCQAERTLSGDGMAVSVELPDDDDDDEESMKRVVIVPEKAADKDGNETGNSNPFILSEAQMRQIASAVLPPALMLCRWKRLYSLARDGDSFDTFLRLLAGEGRSLLVIRTTMDEVFGAYSDSPYETTRHKHGAGTAASSYYGSAQACLWRILPGGNVEAYKWTGMNRYIQLVDVRSKMIAFGGGGNAGEFGLCVEDDFRRGSTGPCGTFGNDPLCDRSDGGSFEVVDVECWGFLSGFA